MMKIPADMKATNIDEAIAMSLTAEQIRHNSIFREDRNKDFNQDSLLIADNLNAAADKYLIVSETPVRGVGGEFILSESIQSDSICPPSKNADRVNIEASIDRVALASKNGVLSMALDTAESIDANNAVEQMIAHQMAVAHRTSLDLIADAGNIANPIEKCRLINTANKLMNTIQNGYVNINKVRNAGQQTMTVQYVQVDNGGQAIVNGSANLQGALKK